MQPTYGDKLPPYHDLDVVRELARLQRAANLAASKAPLVADESKKWLEWDEFLDVVRALRAECAGTGGQGEDWERRFLSRTSKLDKSQVALGCAFALPCMEVGLRAATGVWAASGAQGKPAGAGVCNAFCCTAFKSDGSWRAPVPQGGGCILAALPENLASAVLLCSPDVSPFPVG